MNLPAPIALFVYNRPWHTRETLRSLAANALAQDSELIIYADGLKEGATSEQIENHKLVQDIIREKNWCKTVRIYSSDSNQGLSNSIISGVTQTLKGYDRVIVLEDDMVLSPYFLEFMNEGLEKYEQASEVISIHGYCVPIDYKDPVFFLRGADCWGWATWRRGWQLFNPDGKELLNQLQASGLLFDFDFNGNYDYSGMLRKQIEGKVNSWAIRWYASAYLQNKLTLYPSHSLVVNIGSDGSGTHAQSEKETRTQLHLQKINIPDIALAESKLARQSIGRYFNSHLGIKAKVKKLLKWGY